MRMLFVSYAERTQAEPMVPLAWAAKCAGHDVLVATQPELVETLADSGLPVTAVGRSLPLYRLWQHAEDVEGDGEGDLALLDPERAVDFESGVSAYQDLVDWWYRTANEPMLRDLVELCGDWEPDLVIWETATFAGAVAARACGIPHLRFLWTYDVMTLMRDRLLSSRPPDDDVDPLREWLTDAAQRVGTDFDDSLVTGDASITFMPEPMRALDPPTVRYLPMRFVPYAGRMVRPPWLDELTERPRACVSFGTSALARFGRLVVPAADVVRGVAAAGLDVLVTLEDAQEAGFTPDSVPANVRFVGRVPLDAVLEHCDLAVHHGGPGTLATAMLAAVPQLLIPEEFDAPVLSRMFESTGAGACVPLSEASAETVERQARRLSGEATVKRAALDLRTEVLSMPSPRDLVELLEQEFVQSTGRSRA